MIQKYLRFVFVFVLFGFATPVRAQTMDAAMKVQAILDQFSEIRSQLKQIQSSLNIETMLGNLNGDFREALKNVGGTIMDRNKKTSTQETALLIVPDGLENKLDNPEQSAEWLRDNLHPKVGMNVEEIAAVRDQASQFEYVMVATAYGKAIVSRKKLDESMKKVDKLRQDAEATTAETDLQNELNKLGLLKMEQAELTQALKATELQFKNFSETRKSEINKKVQRTK